METGMDVGMGMSMGTEMDMDMGMGMDNFWLPTTEARRSFSPGEAPSQVMNWYMTGNTVGRNGSENGQPHARSRAGPVEASAHDVLSPTRNMFRPTSQGTTPTTTLSESPSDSSGPSFPQRSVEVAETTPGGGSDDSSPQHAAVAENTIDNQLSVPQPSNWPAEFSLEFRQGYSNQLVGLSCESDPFLLRHYRFNAQGTYHMLRLDFRKVVDDVKSQDPSGPTAPTSQSNSSTDNDPIQFMMCDETIWADDIKATERLLSGDGTEAADMALLNKVVNPDLGARLLKLYSRFVHPRYPVLSLSDLRRIPESDCSLSLPIGIRSAVYALAAPFSFLDDELSVSKGYGDVPTEDLWAIAHRSFQRAGCLSHISLLQLCLLLLQMPPQNFVVAEPSKFWALSCSAVAIAENLGVNMEPTGWRLPREEIMLRRRLWWLTYVAHTWHALVYGRPSHLNDANWFVSKLTEDDFERGEGEDLDSRRSILQQIPICLAQFDLGLVAADVLKEFYSIRAHWESPTLNSLLSRAQPLRARIESWRQTLPLLSTRISELSEDDFDNGAALRLSHLTLEIMIFRALLRPLAYDAESVPERCQEPISTIFENCYICASVATEIVSSLRSKHFASFWPHYTRFQLCYVSTFILLNLAQSATKEMALRNKALLDKWRDTLRIQARAWPLARLAAMRLDAIFWKGVSSVIHGAGPDSPAVLLLNEPSSRESGDGRRT
ncbi:uncharacterized protein DNG_00863 [Cephalotrichum gorgonifer]|uniref:Xylanolytic transcriptional activator regulatory domain-containing protein n=1 Tax=Cephalotrichum gorgonifer TaxID=2041049 RepID=A0AAE8MQ42_9PEZI|nr:uncharacterized protein DNG_00863 [Cephalotrichum gorgonifer]